jgi:uncharacterized protein involved in response to NO
VADPALRTPDPYRLLFPLGFAFALAGAALWPLHAFGLIPYPGPLHRALMIQGFELSFVMGFLLTALPGFTKAERCHPVELAIAAASALTFGVAAFTDRPLVAQIAFTAAVLMLLVAAGRRVRHARVAPPMEFLFVGFGLLLGMAGGVLQCLSAAGLDLEPVPRFGERLLSLGMVLSLVLGVGSLLVPTFAGMRDPLVIPGIAGPHERRGRLWLYLALMAWLALAFVAEAAGHGGVGASLRAIAATGALLLGWKITRMPGRRDVPAFVLWCSGWLVLAGLWLAALAPGISTGALHLVFIGGFGLLTLGIGTRVIVAHGGHPIAFERATLGPAVVIAVAIALAARLAAEFFPARPLVWLGVSGAAWILAWLIWGARALPRLARLAPRPADVGPAPKS